MTLLLGFAAVNTGNNLLYLLVSALLGFMVVSGLLGQQNLRRLQLQIFPPGEIYAGQPTLIGLQLENRRRLLPAFLIAVEIRGERALFPLIVGGQTEQRSLCLTLSHRGRQPLGEIWLHSCFPINFFVRSSRLRLQPQLLVFPRPVACRLPIGDGSRTAARQQEQARPGYDGELRTIYDYQGGEPLKAIHWKLSARHEELKVKGLSGQGAPPVILDLEQLPGAGLEERLSSGSYLINQLSRRQQPLGLKLNQRLIAPALGAGHKRKLLTELSLYGSAQK